MLDSILELTELYILLLVIYMLCSKWIHIFYWYARQQYFYKYIIFFLLKPRSLIESQIKKIK